MAAKRIKKPGLLDVLFSVMVEPGATTARLLSITPPPHVITTLFLFLCICIAPPVVQVDSRVQASQIPQVIPLVLTVILTIVLSAIFIRTALKALQVRCRLAPIVANLIYTTAPLTTLMTVTLFANHLVSGELSLLYALGTGTTQDSDVVVKTFPMVLRIALALSLVVLACGYRFIARSSLLPALLMAVGTIPLILGSFVVSMTVIDIFIRDASIGTIRFFEYL